MEVFVYILQSEKTNGYYIGQTENIAIRLQQHNAPDNTEYTRRDQPWQLKIFFVCACRKQARKIEQHIKKMKSRKYIETIIRYPEIIEKIQAKYPCT